MFGIDTVGKFDPVIFTIDSEDDDQTDYDYYFDDVSIPLSFEAFSNSLLNSGKSLEDTYDYMKQYYDRLIHKGDELKTDITRKNKKLNELLTTRKHLETVRDQINKTVLFIERKVFLVCRDTFKRTKAVKKKDEYRCLLRSVTEEQQTINEKMKAEVEKLRRQLSFIQKLTS